ncbi:tripartite tricarboxylate transporter substrate binding protein [Xenophilus azovorans]|uniref:Bug family tripartite tricarboxylate transporter substrate binding protein n=1 Tax=Xenophilus TaxID=151754 RepID=UPI0006899581|nr:tripartite tricarboxylate transporter substrate-binding protein [Xenophilus azovorans]
MTAFRFDARRRDALRLLTAGAAAAACPALRAQEAFPSRPIRVVVPFAAGGAIDVAVRAMTDRVAQEVRQPVVVEAKPGAATILGAEAVASAAPDGYTVLVTTSSTTINNAGAYKKLPYDPARSFAPVTQVSMGSVMFAGPANAPYADLQGFVRWAKAQGRPISYGSWGKGSSAHLFGELLRMRHGLPMQHVPYKGDVAALTDLRGGVIDSTFCSPVSARPLVRANAVKALGMTGPRRSGGLPELPTFGEQGLEGFELAGYVAVYVPAGTPAPVIRKLNQAFVAAIRTPEVSQRLIDQGQDPVAGTPEELAAVYERDAPQWLALMKAAGVEPE